MKYLAPKLKHRFQLLQAVQDPGRMTFKLTYKRLIRLWGGIKNRNERGVNGLQPIRHENIGSIDSHEILLRYTSIYGRRSQAFQSGYDNDFNANQSKGLSKSFDLAFSTEFDSIPDFNPIKTDYFLFLEGNNPSMGRFYKVNRIIRDDQYKEFIQVMVTEQQEQGTGGR
ncbi:hypothetical protein KAR91_01075 [Candidatus Pacearchaeota archaeon]|nr:hypothetical protein [Candidatus Pacearchaeota archaeon]